MWLPEAQGLGLDQLYRALDLLALEGEAIEQEVFWHAVDLFKLEVDLVFYDATTAWFAHRGGGRRRADLARPRLPAVAQARPQQGGPGQRPAGDRRARRYPRLRGLLTAFASRIGSTAC